MNNQPTTEDRIWAVLSHLSALAFGMGILLPIIGWSEQRRKSNYASFQCLQALGYQSLGYTIWLLSYLLLVMALVVIVVVLSFMENGENNIYGFMGVWMSVFLFIIFGALGIYFLLPIIAAVSCALGKDFRYPLMGNRLAHYLAYDPTSGGEEQTWLIEDHEDRWVAAMGHFSIIIAIWGMLTPLTAWILQGNRSTFLKFQSMQTVAYQAVVNILYFGAVFIYMLGFFAFVAVTGLVGVAQDGGLPLGMLSLVAFIGFLLLAFVIFLLIPLFHILGQWAGYRVLKGDNYRYPVLGKLVEKRISRNDVEENLA